MTYHSFVEVLKDEVQIAALSFMALIYAVKIWLLTRKNAIVDQTPDRGDPGAGVRYSFATIAMPWETEIYRKSPIRYLEFAIFHIGIAVAITATFIIPYRPDAMLSQPVMHASQVIIAFALVAGVSRLVRRVTSPAMRAISSADDYFSIALLDIYLLSAILALPDSATDNWTVVVFFALTAFFLIYVPFSKISHYILWPFSRYYIGKHFGKRGVYPKQPGGLKPTMSRP